MKNQEILNWQDEEALRRYLLISPLLEPSLDSAQKIAKRRQIAADNGCSEKTIKRYADAFEKCGFSGLRPKPKAGYMSAKLPPNFPDLLNEAIVLKREVPTRSVEQIIYILEGEERVEPGLLKRSTLQRYLFNAGFGQKQMKKYQEGLKSTTSKRFCKPHRMMLVQADIKYGPGLLVTKDGKKATAYLSSMIDDHSRYILASEWYVSQDEYSVEDIFRKAVLKHGKYDRAYTDNGSQYLSRQLKLSCAKLGIRLTRAKPFSGKSKGKIEKFHQVVDDFIKEVKLKKPKDIEEINRYWKMYLEEYYHKRPHDGIREYYETNGVTVSKEGITPEQEWNRDSRPLVFIDVSTVGEAFLHHEKRTLDKGGCMKLKGHKYEVSTALIGASVEVAYDPNNLETVLVYYKDMEPVEAHQVKITEYCSADPEIPIVMQEKEPVTSRFLDVIEKRYRESQKKLANAISYTDIKEDE